MSGLRLTQIMTQILTQNNDSNNTNDSSHCIVVYHIVVTRFVTGVFLGNNTV